MDLGVGPGNIPFSSCSAPHLLLSVPIGNLRPYQQEACLHVPITEIDRSTPVTSDSGRVLPRPFFFSNRFLFISIYQPSTTTSTHAVGRMTSQSMQAFTYFRDKAPRSHAGLPRGKGLSTGSIWVQAGGKMMLTHLEGSYF